jgi:hypothetical protein
MTEPPYPQCKTSSDRHHLQIFHRFPPFKKPALPSAQISFELACYGAGRGLSSIGVVSIKRFDRIIDCVITAYFLKCGDSIWLRYAESLA